MDGPFDFQSARTDRTDQFITVCLPFRKTFLEKTRSKKRQTLFVVVCPELFYVDGGGAQPETEHGSPGLDLRQSSLSFVYVPLERLLYLCCYMQMEKSIILYHKIRKDAFRTQCPR